MNTLGTKLLLCLLAVAILAAPGWIVSFALTTKIYDWNNTIGNKWGNWGVFIAFVSIPVYGITLLGDAMIFNTIEFHGGANPFVDKPAPEGRVIENGDTKIVMERAGDKIWTRVYEKDQLVQETYLLQDEDGAFVKTDAQGNVLARILKRADGSALVTDASGDQREYSADQVASLNR